MLFKKKPLLPPAVQEAVVAAIRAAEAKTTGEIRVFIESHCSFVDALDRAKEVFSNLSMELTEERNAILVYAALKDKQFAIFGDEEIYHKAGGPQFWECAALLLQKGFRKGAADEGLVACITELGNALGRHFPFKAEVDKNELPDEIVFGK